MTNETIAIAINTVPVHATTGVPDEPPTPREPPQRTPGRDDDEDEMPPPTPPSEPAPVPMQDPPAEADRNIPQIV